jgi:hypothetical protein
MAAFDLTTEGPTKVFLQRYDMVIRDVRRILGINDGRFAVVVPNDPVTSRG